MFTNFVIILASYSWTNVFPWTSSVTVRLTSSYSTNFDNLALSSWSSNPFSLLLGWRLHLTARMGKAQTSGLIILRCSFLIVQVMARSRSLTRASWSCSTNCIILARHQTPSLLASTRSPGLAVMTRSASAAALKEAGTTWAENSSNCAGLQRNNSLVLTTARTRTFCDPVVRTFFLNSNPKERY